MITELLSQQKNYLKILLELRKFDADIKKIDQKARVLVLIESESGLSMSYGEELDSIEVHGMIELYRIRIEENERFMIRKRLEMQNSLKDALEKAAEDASIDMTINKGKVN